jgi:hypothetical protein
MAIRQRYSKNLGVHDYVEQTLTFISAVRGHDTRVMHSSSHFVRQSKGVSQHQLVYSDTSEQERAVAVVHTFYDQLVPFVVEPNHINERDSHPNGFWSIYSSRAPPQRIHGVSLRR